MKPVAPYRITEGKGFRLKDFDPDDTCGLQLDKGEATDLLHSGTAWLAEAGHALRPESLVLAARLPGDGRSRKRRHDQARHVWRQSAGCQVCSFKQPSSEELDHDFMWRYFKYLPERGRIGIFNLSH